MPRRVMQGVVVSDKMDKSIVVKVERRIMHPIYKKYMRRSKKYLAHDETNAARIGDTVRIVETRPMSKRKCWELLVDGENAAQAAPGVAADAPATATASIEDRAE